MRFAEFQLDRVVFEARFEKAFKLWDSAGAISTALVEAFPGLQNTEAAPDKLVFIEREHRFDIAVQLQRVGVTLYSGKSTMEDMADMCQKVMTIVMRFLAIPEFERVGARALYKKNFGSISEAAEALYATGLVATPKTQPFNMKKRPELVDLRLRWEEGPRGVLCMLRTEKVFTEFKPPRELRKDLEAKRKEEVNFAMDVDYFSAKPISAGQFSAQDWISSLRGITNRDLPQFLGFL